MCHFTPVRMAIIKKTRDSQCQQGCGEKGTLMYGWPLMELESGSATMANRIFNSCKIKNRNFIKLSNPTSRFVLSTLQQVNEQLWLYIQIMEYHWENKSDHTVDTKNTLDESQGNYSEWEKLNLKGYMLYDSVYMTSSKRQLYRNAK